MYGIYRQLGLRIKFLGLGLKLLMNNYPVCWLGFSDSSKNTLKRFNVCSDAYAIFSWKAAQTSGTSPKSLKRLLNERGS